MKSRSYAFGAVVCVSLACNPRVESRSERSAATVAVAPEAFAITGPVAVGNVAAPTVTWTSAALATTYDVKIALAADCESPIQEYSDVAITTQALEALADGSYFVCVTAKNDDGDPAAQTTASNDGWKFEIDTTAPGAFNVVAPSAAFKTLTPTLSWSKSTDAAAYEILIAKQADCTTPVQQKEVAQKTSIQLAALENGAYFACVTARDAAGNLLAAANSPVKFTVAVETSFQLVIEGPDEPASYTCHEYGVTLRSSSNAAANADAETTVTLSGMGSGGVYQSLDDCRKGETASLITISAGASSTTFYFRTSTAESLTLRAAADGHTAGTLPIDAELFQILGQPTGLVNANAESGQLNPRGVVYAGGKLFVADTGNHRVLVWNSLPTTNGQVPDFALGQQMLSGTTFNSDGLSPSSLYSPSAVASDGVRLFVADKGNNRVLVWNALPTANGEAADFALGQPTVNSNTANNGGISASRMNAPSGVQVSGARLYVADTNNHRVLVWTSLPSADGEAAAFALGQPDLTSSTVNNGGVSASTLSSPLGVDSDGTRVFVADSGNHRVLVWSALPAASGQAANFALGQPNLTSNTSNNGGVSASSLYGPSGVSSDGTRLFVADPSNGRVLVWSALPTANGEAASLVLGQTNMTSNTVSGTSGTKLYSPSGVFISGTRLFVADYGNNRTLMWSSIPTANAQTATLVLGQARFTTRGSNNGSDLAYSQRYPWDVWSDGTRFILADSSNHRVLVWDTLPDQNHLRPDFVLGQPSLTANSINSDGTPTGATMFSPQQAFFDGTRLFVADTNNNRVLVWNSFPSANGQPADFALGQPNLTTATQNTGGLSASSMRGPRGVWSDGTRLFVADSDNHRVLVWSSMPTTTGAPASFALGQPGLTSNTANNGGLSASSLSSPTGLVGDGTRLYVADGDNNRVLVWSSLPTASAQAASLALGQPDLVSGTANNGGRSGSTLYLPQDVHTDGTHLFVSDYFNSRVLFWNELPTATGQTADFALGQPALDTISGYSSGMSASNVYQPAGVFSDGTRAFIADAMNDRTVIMPLPEN